MQGSNTQKSEIEDTVSSIINAKTPMTPSELADLYMSFLTNKSTSPFIKAFIISSYMESIIESARKVLPPQKIDIISKQTRDEYTSITPKTRDNISKYCNDTIYLKLWRLLLDFKGPICNYDKSIEYIKRLGTSDMETLEMEKSANSLLKLLDKITQNSCYSETPRPKGRGILAQL